MSVGGPYKITMGHFDPDVPPGFATTDAQYRVVDYYDDYQAGRPDIHEFHIRELTAEQVARCIISDAYHEMVDDADR